MQTAELTTTNILSLMETDKAQRKSFVCDVIERMEEGEVDPLKVHCQIKSMESLLKMFTDKKDSPETALRYSDLVLSAAQKHGKKFGLHNGEFQIKEAGSTFDWTVCNDQYLNDLLLQMEDIKDSVKKRQDFLKTVPTSGFDTLDEKSGELVKLYPPAKSSTTVVSVSIK